MNIHERLLKVQAAVGRVPKSGWNNFQKYNYVTESDLLDAARQALIDNGIALVMVGMDEETGVYASENKDPKRWAKVKLHYDIVNVHDSTDRISTSSVGYAEDTGDKAIYKAITGASKYLYYKLLMVSTGEDPERDEQPAGKAGQAYAKKPQPAARSGTTAKSNGDIAPKTATPLPDVAALKTTIRRVAREKGIEPKDVGTVTGVGAFWESEDPNLLTNVLSALQAS